LIENQTVAVINHRPAATGDQSVREAEATVGAVECADRPAKITMVWIAVLPGLIRLLEGNMKVTLVETTIFHKLKVKVFRFNVKPSILLPRLEFRHALIAIEEHLAGMILEALLRVKFQANQPAGQDCEPGVAFVNHCCRVGLGCGCGVNCLDHSTSETG